MFKRALLVLTSVLISFVVSGCIPLSVEHDVTPDVSDVEEQTVPDFSITAVRDEELLKQVIDSIEDTDLEYELIDSETFMRDVFVESETGVSYRSFANEDVRTRASRNVDYIIVIGQTDSLAREADISICIVKADDQDDMQIRNIHAEGKFVGLWPAPLPWLSLLLIGSTPDTVGSAIDAVGPALETVVGDSNKGKRTRIVILRSDDLTNIVQRVRLERGTESETSGDRDRERSKWNPFYLYLEVMDDAERDGQALMYNPISQFILLTSSIMLTPLVWVMDKQYGDASAYSGGPPTTEEVGAMDRARKAVNREEWSLAYRELEVVIPSQNQRLRESSRALFDATPQLALSAQNSFSIRALRESQAIHGERALEIERNRLRIYKVVASRDAYLLARSNMRKAYPGYRGDSVMGLDEAVIETMAVQGDAEAQWQMYWNTGNEEALKWLCRASDQSHPGAQQRLGLLFENGAQGVKKNYTFAYLWYEKAAQSFRTGDPGRFLSKRDAARIAQELSGEELAEANKLLLDRRPNQCVEQLGFSEPNRERE